QTPPKIVCVGGRNELDDAAARCLVHLLRQQPDIGPVEAISADTLGSNNLRSSSLRAAGLVCLSLISTGSPARARYLVRRIRRRAPRAKIMVGFWGLAPGEPSTEIIASTTAEVVTFSLRDALANIDTLSAAETPAS